MKIRVPDLRLRLEDVARAPQALTLQAARELRIDSGRILTMRVKRRSLDARRRGGPVFVVSVEVEVAGPGRFPGSRWCEATEDDAPAWKPQPPVVGGPPPVIVGAGPAGLFCAMALLEAGVRPILLERGRTVERRKLDVAELYRRGLVDPESNVSFGEGGAGTFTDGKLSTGVRGAEARRVPRLLVELGGADSDILVSARPHLGSEKLPEVMARLRERLVQAGCEMRFETRVESVVTERGRVAGVRLANGETVDGPAVVLAPGNAAREIYRSLGSVPGVMRPKPFAVGLRIEHPQSLIDEIQYGAVEGHAALPPAEYSLAARARGRGVWSFCMCPGGVVVPTPTTAGTLCVNGMSSSRRAGRFANSALVVEVGPADFSKAGLGEDLLAGVVFQERLEEAAYDAGGGGLTAPAQRLTDFLAGRTRGLGGRSSYPRGLSESDLWRLLPMEVATCLSEAIGGFGRKLRGFVTEEAVLIGVETRTSAPVSFARARDGSSPAMPGLYPCGEGCGHGGGIVSAAADGLRVGALLARELAPC